MHCIIFTAKSIFYFIILPIIFINFVEHEPKTTCHPEAYYASRKIRKIDSEYLLSSNIIVTDKTMTSDNFGMFIN
jgi:hypothetical protein